ncbi:MAG: phospho-sugar mutase, partial [Bacillota bacterium]|nr:phospho-sugar mutase [Bacillota bacterium]
MEYREIYSMWLKSPYITDRDRKILECMTVEEVHEAFYKTAEFGTGGMRGIMGPGTNRLNRYTIRLAAKGFADTLPEKARVVVAYDTRNGSRAFAEETAKVFAACGKKVYLFDRPSPVPLLSFAVRQLKADGGVVITASHNTKEYNGFKAYDETGCQLLPDKTEAIAGV